MLRCIREALDLDIDTVHRAKTPHRTGPDTAAGPTCWPRLME